MNITYIGAADECGTKVCNYLADTHTITMITDQTPIYEIECNILVEKTLWIADYFDNNTADLVIYHVCNNDYTLLNQWLNIAANRTGRFIIVKQGSFETSSDTMVSIEELLCTEYSHDTSTKITVLNTSVLYGTKTAPHSLRTIIDGIIKKNMIEFPDGFQKTCDALHIEDFCKFLGCFIETKAEADEDTFFVQSGYAFLAKELLQKISKRYPQAENLYETERLHEAAEIESLHLEGWMPTHSFIDDLDYVITEIESQCSKENKRKMRTRMYTVGKIAVFLLVCIVVELYVNFVSAASDLQFVDMRLILIALSAVILNQRYAVAGALLCSFASIAQSLANGYRWHVLFFHVNNWIPIAIYILFAMIIGSYADRIRNQNQS